VSLATLYRFTHATTAAQRKAQVSPNPTAVLGFVVPPISAYSRGHGAAYTYQEILWGMREANE